MDKGHWNLCSEPGGKLVGVSSDDFEHDVLLRVDGDFESDQQKREYCVWLMRRLNESTGGLNDKG